MTTIQKEWNILQTAIMFFTRIPVRKNLTYSEAFLNSSSKYLPFVGWIVGGASGLVFLGMNYIFPSSIAILFSMVASLLITGAFHEDGFADVCDGFGGGWTKEKILLIMKDSRIGAYGMIGMFSLLLAKFIALSEISTGKLPLVLLTGHTISRFFAVQFIFMHDYAREDSTSKAKPLGKKIKSKEFVFAILTALIPFMLFSTYYVFISIPVLYLIYYFFAKYIKKWIGGYTGDCLGAMQQLTELGFYLSVILLDNNIIEWL